MRKYILLIILTLLVVTCFKSKKQQNPVYETIYPIKTSMFAVIDDKSAGKDSRFLLANPFYTLISDSGHILIGDENHIKIFNNKGENYKILGNRGQGPNEYMYPFFIYVYPNGTINTYEPESNYYSIYNKKYQFVNKKKFEKSNNLNAYLEQKGIDKDAVFSVFSFLAIDEKRIVYWIALEERKINKYYWLLAYEDENKFIPIYWGKNDRIVITKTGRYSSTTLGYILLTGITEDEICYYVSSEDKYIDDNIGQYFFHIYSLKTEKDTLITNFCEPKKFSKESILNSSISKRTGELDKDIKKFYEQKKYFPLLLNIFPVNSTYIFNCMWQTKNKNRIFHIYDIKTKKYLCTAGWDQNLVYPMRIAKSLYPFPTKNEKGYQIVQIYSVDLSFLDKIQLEKAGK